MSQSLLNHAFGVQKGYECRKTEYLEGQVEFHLSIKEEMLRCPDCGHGPCRRRGKSMRRIAAVPIGLKPTVLVTEVPACLCQKTGKTFAVSPPFAQAYCRYTRGMERFVCQLSRWTTLAEVAGFIPLCWDTVKEIVKSDLGQRYARIPLKGVKYLAIDELHVARKGKFLTMVIDLESGDICESFTIWGGNEKQGLLVVFNKSDQTLDLQGSEIGVSNNKWHVAESWPHKGITDRWLRVAPHDAVLLVSDP